MSNFFILSSVTFSLRLISILSKFILFLFLGKYIDTASIGVYGMIATIIVMLTQILGLEFHYFNTREIQKKQVGQRGGLIRNQFSLHFITYCITFPFLILFFIFDFIDYIFIIYFYVLLLFECLAQELFRILAANQMPVQATISVFLRSVPWVISTIILFFFNSQIEIIKTILYTWILSSLSAVIFSVYSLKHELILSIFKKAINWSWIKQGLITVIPFMFTAIAFSTSAAIDKFFIKSILGEESLGIYFFMFSLASGYSVLLSFSVGIIYGPKVLHSYYNQTTKEFLEVRKTGIIKTLIIGALLIIPAIFGIYIVLYFIDNQIYTDNINIYFLLLLANVIWAFSDLLNYDLYIRSYDYDILFVTIIGAAITIVIQYILINLFGMKGAAFAAIVSFSLYSLMRYFVLKIKVPGFAILMTYQEKINSK